VGGVAVGVTVAVAEGVAATAVEDVPTAARPATAQVSPAATNAALFLVVSSRRTLGRWDSSAVDTAVSPADEGLVGS
jgi:hypothetical protein